VVAYWADYPLRPSQRSTLFGFTSNYPPEFRPLPDTPDVRAANLRADGEVPTPVAFEQPALPVAGGSTAGTLGGVPGGIGAGGGLLRGGFGGGGFGFPFGGGLGAGGGTGGGTGGGNPATTSTTPAVRVPFNVTPNPAGQTVNLSNTNTNQQSQAQLQAQAQVQAQAQIQLQTQRQHDRHGHGHVVPEPAAFVPALLGVPVLLWLALRRRKVPQAA
jgi:hypothetical protein